MGEETKSLREQVTTAFARRGQMMHEATQLYRAFFFAAAAGIAGAMQFWSWKADEQPTTAQVVGIAATLVVLVASLISIRSEKDASSELALAQSAITKAQEVEDQLQEIALQWPDFDRIISLYQFTKLMRDALEQSSLARSGDLNVLIATLLAISAKPLRVAMGYKLGDEWTICVFRAEKLQSGRAQLRLIAHDRTIDCDLSKARIWPEGVGVAGVAYSHQHELLVDDLAADAIRSIFQPPGLRRPYDDERYRSMIAVPISTAGAQEPWGVVTATSDRVGHFNHNSGPGLKPEEAVRALADYVALTVSFDRASEAARQAAPVVI